MGLSLVAGLLKDLRRIMSGRSKAKKSPKAASKDEKDRANDPAEVVRKGKKKGSSKKKKTNAEPKDLSSAKPESSLIGEIKPEVEPVSVQKLDDVKEDCKLNKSSELKEASEELDQEVTPDEPKASEELKQDVTPDELKASEELKQDLTPVTEDVTKSDKEAKTTCVLATDVNKEFDSAEVVCIPTELNEDQKDKIEEAGGDPSLSVQEARKSPCDEVIKADSYSDCLNISSIFPDDQKKESEQDCATNGSRKLSASKDLNEADNTGRDNNTMSESNTGGETEVNMSSLNIDDAADENVSQKNIPLDWNEAEEVEKETDMASSTSTDESFVSTEYIENKSDEDLTDINMKSENFETNIIHQDGNLESFATENENMQSSDGNTHHGDAKMATEVAMEVDTETRSSHLANLSFPHSVQFPKSPKPCRSRYRKGLPQQQQQQLVFPAGIAPPRSPLPPKRQALAASH